MLLACLSCCIFLSAQVPQGFNYQAIARDSKGAIQNQALPVMITIQNASGTKIYEELFSSITTDQFGLISLVVGTGARQAGSAASFSAIDWKAQSLYLKTTIQYPGTTWTTMGTSQIMAVPYSLVAKDVTGPLTKLGIKGTTDDMEEALFEVKNKTGQTVFAVYNEGVRVYVDNGAKGTKGGFAVGGFGSDKAPSQNLLVVNPDSIRAYIDTNAGKGTKGGFAVGGFDSNKTLGEEYLRVTRDSTRVYLNDTGTKSAKGGFAVGGFGSDKGLTNNYMLIKPDSSLFYVRSVTKGTSSTFNVIALNPDLSPKSLITANTDTVDISGVLNVQKNLIVQGNIGVTGTVGSNPVSDVDGNSYKTVKIGSQLWMAENLRTTSYNDYTSIPNVTDPVAWQNSINGSYCDYDNIPSNSDVFGRLYNWYTVDPNNSSNVCPTGWHVPSNAEWLAMMDYLVANGNNFDGTNVGYNIAKSLAADPSKWNPSETAGSPGTTDYTIYQNKSGFTALPGGSRNWSDGFMQIGYEGSWWSSTEYVASKGGVYLISVGYDNPTVTNTTDSMNSGYSVRCVKDN